MIKVEAFFKLTELISMITGIPEDELPANMIKEGDRFIKEIIRLNGVEEAPTAEEIKCDGYIDYSNSADLNSIINKKPNKEMFK